MSTSTAQMRQDWNKLIEQIQHPLPMRPGSISQQRTPVRRKDGTIRHKGPYPLYTFKKQAKTVSRILDERELPAYQQAIENFHGFLAVIEQIKSLGLVLADAQKLDLKKNSKTWSKRKNRRR
jgi:hypothetical protein